MTKSTSFSSKIGACVQNLCMNIHYFKKGNNVKIFFFFLWSHWKKKKFTLLMKICILLVKKIIRFKKGMKLKDGRFIFFTLLFKKSFLLQKQRAADISPHGSGLQCQTAKHWKLWIFYPLRSRWQENILQCHGNLPWWRLVGASFFQFHSTF